MKKILVMLVLLVFAVNVSAMTSNVTVISDEVYTGAILELRNIDSGEVGEKRYYPFFIGKNIGVIKIEVETGLSEANFSLQFTNHGEVCLNIEKGPFVINGSDIILDLGKVEEISPIEEPIENSSVDNVSEEVSEEVDFKIDEKRNILVNNPGLIGYASQYSGNLQNNIYILIGLGVLFVGIFMFFIVQKAYKSGAKGVVELLGRMEIDRKIDELDNR
ncbi:MAG: hypothetical protein ABIH79_00985 [archaeon]